MGVCAGDAESPLLSSNGATCPSLYNWTEIKSRETLGRQTCFSGKHHLRSQALRCTGFLGLEGAAIAFLILVF